MEDLMFSKCHTCGAVILPGEGEFEVRGDETIVVCRDCFRGLNGSIENQLPD
jgi:ribosomal protein L24E